MAPNQDVHRLFSRLGITETTSSSGVRRLVEQSDEDEEPVAKAGRGGPKGSVEMGAFGAFEKKLDRDLRGGVGVLAETAVEVVDPPSDLSRLMERADARRRILFSGPGG